MKKELIEIQEELLENYKEQVSAEHVLSILSEKVISAAQIAIDKANTTTSYDEKISTLVAAVQEVVKIVVSEKKGLDVLKTKYQDQSEIINQLIDRAMAPDEEI